MFSVYVLYSSGYNRRYTGLTKDVEKRVGQHNAKQNKSTKHYTPWKLILVEAYESREEARERERYLKSGIGREFIDNLLRKEQ